ncbi:MAG: hypothetical protein MR821_00285 [Clostridiales bacterium]|nr:hypothetical protein [Clostridiales bacterium]
MKKWMNVLLLCAALLLPALSLADGPVLLVELPDDAQMIENVAFEDGDFIQSYQLAGGTQVQLLRYASFGMTLEELAGSDWPDATAAAKLDVKHVGGCPASGLRLTSPAGDGSVLEVTLVLVDAGAYTLIFSAVCPQGADAQAVETMLSTMNVLETGESAADVG